MDPTQRPNQRMLNPAGLQAITSQQYQMQQSNPQQQYSTPSLSQYECGSYLVARPSETGAMSHSKHAAQLLNSTNPVPPSNVNYAYMTNPPNYAPQPGQTPTQLPRQAAPSAPNADALPQQAVSDQMPRAQVRLRTKGKKKRRIIIIPSSSSSSSDSDSDLSESDNEHLGGRNETIHIV
ncbi:hypothetical protein WR25_07012 [Diploscapter pachys]|uniref:Uncharacterized protein n=1 Tax=Diploscapter pachys TaxID=2018661 RepID=A0A2A2LW68_9BILA|nr:hypothetical protein WR25_07012 [Diploscapter pachys]